MCYNRSMALNLIDLYKQKYYIKPADLADQAETNRLHILFVCPFLFVFGVGDLIVIFSMHLHNLRDYLSSIIYFSIFTIASAAAYIYSKLVKNVDRKKAYIIKTIPFYLLLCIALSAAVYNFYILGQPFNGVITYFITGLIALMAFTFAPIFFFITITTGLAFLIPGVYRNFGLTGLLDTLIAAILLHGFSLYKRFTEKKLQFVLKKQRQVLEAKTFGNFTLMYDNKVIRFSRSKSAELLAYLIYKNGSSVQTKELINVLWGDHADSSRYGSNLRNLIVDIKHSLLELEIQNFFVTEYNNFRINPQAIKCDYYNFLAGDTEAIKSFAGEFMSQFSWAEETTGFLEMKAIRH